MLKLRDILKSQSDILEGKRVKLIRHTQKRADYRDIIKDKNDLLAEQRGQSEERYKNCDYIVSFIALERSHAILLGVFKVGAMTKTDTYNYELEQVSEFDSLVDRLVIDWGDNAISWHQWYDRQEKDVIQILPEGFAGHFPGLTEFALDFDEMQKIIFNPDANIEWKQHLSAVNGVYLILDQNTGHQYIGSACGKNGIWQRWANYAKNLHGGNKLLKDLTDRDPQYHKNFKYSVLQTLPSNMTQRETVRIEQLYKEKLGSRAHGLNSN